MKKIPITKVIEFKQKSQRSRLTLLNNLEKEKKPKTEDDNGGGGNYWVSCLSAISNVYSTSNKNLLEEKVELLRDKIEVTLHKGTKDRWQKNIDILYSFEDYDFESIKPNTEINFLKKPDSMSILEIHNIPVEVKPHHVFSYSHNGLDEIGAVWFVAKKEGYKRSELGMFCETMYRYLTLNYSDKYKVNPEFCITVDICDNKDVNYSQLLNGNISFLLEETVIEIKKLLSK